MRGKGKKEINVKVELTLNGAVVHDLLHDLLLLGDRGEEGGKEEYESEIDIKVITQH